MTTRGTHEFSIPVAHPTAALHFPGLPVVPGALLLDEAIAAIGAAAKLRLRAVKFLSPLRHGEAVALSWKQDDTGLVAFEMRHRGEGALVVTGTLERLS